MTVPATNSNWNTALLTLNNTQTPKANAEADTIRKTAVELEAVFISEMMSHMFSGLETDPLFGVGKGEEIFRGMMVNEYGKLMSENGGIGFADQIQSFMIQVQENSQGTAP